MTLRFFLFTSFLIITSQTQAQNLEVKTIKDTLLVGLAGSPPFLLKNKTTKAPEGISVEIWEALAINKNRDYKYIPFSNIKSALESLELGEIDLVVGPISITSERFTQMSFTQPYYQSSLAIVSRRGELSLWDRVKPLFSVKLLAAIGVFLFILAIVGMLLWMAERKASPKQFPKDPLKGIANGMWLAIVTMSTTGYGDMAPVTLRGRVIAGSWMVFSIISATSMVAGIASILALSGLESSVITNVEQLSDKKVATIIDAPSVDFLSEYNAKTITVNSLHEAITKLKNNEVEAVVYDRPQLLYYLKNNENNDLYLAKAEYYKQGYGFAFPLKSTLVYDVNRTLLAITEDHSTKRIIDFYLGEKK